MNEEEAGFVRIGDVVSARYSDKYKLVRIESVYPSDWNGLPVSFTVRRLSEGSKRFPAVIKGISQIRKITFRDPVTANVYADFLDEHGEHKAAALLRSAFPIAIG